MHKTWVPTLKVEVTVRGQRSSNFFSLLKKTTDASLTKVHEKVNNNEKACCNQNHLLYSVTFLVLA